METVYATSREIINAFAARDDGEELSARQSQILTAADAGRLAAWDEPRGASVTYVGGGYAVDSRGNLREHFCA